MMMQCDGCQQETTVRRNTGKRIRAGDEINANGIQDCRAVWRQ